MTTPLIPIRHDLLSAVTHGFFTRVGGASSGIFEGLNCGLGSSDQAEVVQINRTRVRETVGADFLQTVHQHHSSYAVVVTNPIAPVPKADAMVTKTKGIALGIMTADCEPILFADTDAGVVGAAHAGWKGARTGVIESTLDAMETLGAARNNIVAVIGPCISQSAYEVGPEFFDEITYDDPDASSFFAQGKDDRYMFDLPSYGLSRLRAAGVKEAAWTGHCTYADSTRFFSYRRSVHCKDPDYGRLIATIQI